MDSCQKYPTDIGKHLQSEKKTMPTNTPYYTNLVRSMNQCQYHLARNIFSHYNLHFVGVVAMFIGSIICFVSSVMVIWGCSAICTDSFVDKPLSHNSVHDCMLANLQLLSFTKRQTLHHKYKWWFACRCMHREAHVGKQIIEQDHFWDWNVERSYDMLTLHKVQPIHTGEVAHVLIECWHEPAYENIFETPNWTTNFVLSTPAGQYHLARNQFGPRHLSCQHTHQIQTHAWSKAENSTEEYIRVHISRFVQI